MANESDPLAGLAFAAARGDRDALTGLIRLTQRDVTRFLASVTSAADVEDLTQETFLRVVRALPSFAGRSSVRTWLFAIARRVAADDVRLATRRPRQTALPGPEATAAFGWSRFDEHQALLGLVRALAADRREAFLLTQVAGLSYLEAAEVCGCPVGTIRSRVARARDELATALRAAEGRSDTA